MGVHRTGERAALRKPAAAAATATATATPAARQGWTPGGAGQARAAVALKIKDASVGASQISKALVAAAKKRQVMLKDFSRAQRPAAVLPEDLSLQVKAMHMAVTGGDITGGELVPEMARIGKAEGFTVLVRTLPYFKANLEKEYAKAGLDNVKVVTMETPNVMAGDFWTEDQGDLDAAGGVAVPAMLRQGRLAPSFTGQAEALAARLTRGWKDPNTVPVSGAVGMRDSQQSLVALAVATGRPLRVNLSHIEGGNQLAGTLADGSRYALVGKDSVAVTEVMLTRELGRKVSAAEVKQAIAADLGIDPKHVFAIEQPGDFHLDMAMSAFQPGQVLLNDARAALALQTKWLEDDHQAKKPQHKPEESPEKFAGRVAEWNEAGKDLAKDLAKLKKEYGKRAALEKLAQADLEAAGLSVVRVPAVFVDPSFPSRQTMNFLNGEGGKSPKGKPFFITQGGEKRAQDVFKAAVAEHASGVRLHFLDKKLSQLTLHDMGGISCRVRAEGQVG